MNRYILICLLITCFSPARADVQSLEKRVAALEQEVATLKEENKKFRDSAIDILATQLAQNERHQARVYYRQILPSIKQIAADFGAKGPVLPKEEEINTFADAYRPVMEMMTQLLTVAGGK